MKKDWEAGCGRRIVEFVKRRKWPCTYSTVQIDFDWHWATQRASKIQASQDLKYSRYEFQGTIAGFFDQGVPKGSWKICCEGRNHYNLVQVLRINHFLVILS